MLDGGGFSILAGRGWGKGTGEIDEDICWLAGL